MRLFFLFTSVALLLTGCFSPWLWAPNAVTGALGLAGALAQAEGGPAAPSDLDVMSVDFSVFEETDLGKSDHSWADGLDVDCPITIVTNSEGKITGAWPTVIPETGNAGSASSGPDC